MLEPLRAVLSSHRIILASASPRRREILANALPNFDIEIRPSNAEENLDKATYRSNPWKYAEDTAELKAQAIMKEINFQENAIVIGTDTVVTLNSVIYEKPRDQNHAKEMLKLLSGQTQKVYSGVCILRGSKDKSKFHECTEVTFDELTQDVIEAYVDSGEPMDKAGGYGIQAQGGTLVKSIHGDYFNVVGFPLHQFCRQMGKLLTSNNQ